MLSLVYKDFIVQRGGKSLIYMIIMPVISAFAAPESVLYAMLPYFAGSYVYMIYANAIDDKWNFDSVLRAMPVSPMKIVLSKYMSAGIYIAAYSLISMTVSAAAHTAIPRYVPAFIGTDFPFQLIPTAAIYFGIFFPVHFGAGYQKCRWVNYLGLMASCGLFGAASQQLTRRAGTEISSIQHGLTLTAGLSRPLWSLIFLAGAAVLTAASVYLSVRLYRRREF